MTHTAVRPPTISSSAARWVVRGLWLLLALFWTAFVVLEGWNHGVGAGVAGFAGLIWPDLAMLVGMKESGTLERGRLSPRAVPYYNALHRMSVPLLIAVAYPFSPWDVPAFFALLCGWMAHIAFDRAAGYGLRDRNGWQRG